MLKSSNLILLEGGAAGGMSHLYDDPTMTFGELKQLITDVSTGNIEYTEKLDGQNIQLSFDPYRKIVLYARNKGQQLRLGATIEDFKAQYSEDHPIYSPFVDAMTAFEGAMKKIAQKTLIELFGDNKTRIFYNCEILDIRSANVIKYDINSIVIHASGHVVATSESVSTLKDNSKVDLLRKELNASKTKIIKVTTPKKLNVNDPAAGKEANAAISKLQSAAKLNDSNTVGDLVFFNTIAQLKKSVSKLAEADYEKLAGKILGKDTTNINNIIKSSPEMLKNKEAVKSAYATADKIYGTAIRQLELIINTFAMKILTNIESEFVKDPSAEKARLRKELQDTIEKLKSVKTEEGKEFVRRQLEKINDEFMSSVEGIVVTRGDRVLKLTGLFAPTNQLLGAFKFGKRGVTVNEASNAKSNGKTIALVPGSFKPPHASHFKMIQHYAAMSDICYVVISDPQSESSIRKTASGKSFSAAQSKQIFEIYAKEYGATNIEFITTTYGPVKWVYEYIGETATPGSAVILGVSDKQDDVARYSKAEKYAKSGVTVKISPYKAIMSGSKPMSATDFRAAIDDGDISKIRSFLPEKLSPSAIKKILRILGI
jgi:hypothetical protein